MPLDRLGEYLDSPLFAYHLHDASEALPELSFDTPHFLCLIGGDFTKIPPRDLVRLVSELLNRGACYFLCWGRGCETAHDLIDDMLIGDERFASEETDIMTTWHSDQSIDDALFYLLCAAWPAEGYTDQPSARFSLLINEADAFDSVSAALEAPAEFIARTSA